MKNKVNTFIQVLLVLSFFSCSEKKDNYPIIVCNINNVNIYNNGFSNPLNLDLNKQNKVSFKLNKYFNNDIYPKMQAEIYLMKNATLTKVYNNQINIDEKNIGSFNITSCEKGLNTLNITITIPHPIEGEGDLTISKLFYFNIE